MWGGVLLLSNNPTIDPNNFLVYIIEKIAISVLENFLLLELCLLLCLQKLQVSAVSNGTKVSIFLYCRSNIFSNMLLI